MNKSLITRTFSLTIFLLSFLSDLKAQQVHLSKSDMFKLDFTRLAFKKKQVQSGDSKLQHAYQYLIKEADQLLKYQPVSVMYKTAIPPSGDKHDYMSIAPYWWPDPSKPNGLPYIRRDGEINPEVETYSDKENMPTLCEHIYMLSLAYYFSDDEKYAAHASKLIQVWFLDTATKMNPNLNFGQAVKGVTNGRAEGIIDTRHFIFVADAIRMLQHSSSWSLQNQSGMQKWFGDFLNWLQTSEIGLSEKNAKNNHGIWYDAQTLSLSLFLGEKDLARSIIARAAERLDKQSDNNGFFPLELARTTSLHYSVFILNAFTIIAQLADEVQVDFWNLETASGKSLKKAYAAAVPFLTKEKNWTNQQIRAFNAADAFPILRQAYLKYNCTSCMDAIQKDSKKTYDQLLMHLF